jgi:hypothetical protein
MRAASWFPGRTVSPLVVKWERELSDHHGLIMHENARMFLTEFGGLRTDDWTPGGIMPQSPFRFDPRTAVDSSANFPDISLSAGTPLYPIGLADRGRSPLGMSVEGAVYIAGSTVELLASSGHEAIEALAMERQSEVSRSSVPTGESLEVPPMDTAPEMRWSAETDRSLRLAGWHPGRRVSTEEWERILKEGDEDFVIHDAARGFLREFGGLAVDQKGPGITMARSPFRLDPTVAKWDYEIFEMLSEEAEAYLYPIGDAARGNNYLGMSPSGAVYWGMDDVRLLAETADEALDKLVQGIQ